jgi:hypothetical protein
MSNRIDAIAELHSGGSCLFSVRLILFVFSLLFIAALRADRYAYDIIYKTNKTNITAMNHNHTA